ncbi:hypothetical protein STSP2_01381 [Anaerohalosphaera lusitana]|uniref:Uncharacterized protein n=1 Tax=Anaerohalosphaera lusitana TaxID=1936003 RepID=A0A1U9NK79_9BACT|nr:hypothetical protein STSP2_01381 [Anaerohalosphaera lusitana]
MSVECYKGFNRFLNVFRCSIMTNYEESPNCDD